MPAAANAAADPALREQVRALVRQAGERMEQGNPKEAATILEQARRLRPDPSLDYNLGVTYAELGQGPDAAQAFVRFLEAADAKRVLPERIADARKRLSDYERSLARLRVRISLPPNYHEAALYLDEQGAGIPLSAGRLAAPLWLRPGIYRLRVLSPGLSDYKVAVDLGAGEVREVTGELYKGEAEGGGLFRELPTSVSKEPKPYYKKWWFWTAVGAGTATAVAFIAAGAAGAFTHDAPGSNLGAVDLRK